MSEALAQLKEKGHARAKKIYETAIGEAKGFLAEDVAGLAVKEAIAEVTAKTKTTLDDAFGLMLAESISAKLKEYAEAIKA